MSTTKPESVAQPRLTHFRIAPEWLPPNCRGLGIVDTAVPDMRLLGWSLLVRGAAVFLVSPRGWKLGSRSGEYDPRGKITAIGPIPMAQVTLTWEMDDQAGVEKLQRVDVPPLARALPVQAAEPAIPSKELGDP